MTDPTEPNPGRSHSDGLEERSLQTDLHIQASYRLTEALVEAEKRMRRRIELLSEVVFEISDSGTLTFLNAAWTKILGFSVEASVGTHLLHYVIPEDRPVLQAFLAAKESTPQEVRFATKAGDVIFAEATCTPLAEGGWIGTLYNVTQRNAARAELGRLSLVASYTDSLVVITDARGRIEWVNRAFTRMTGYELEECLGRTPGSFLQGPDTDAETVSVMRAALQRNESFQCEILNYTKSGEPYWVGIVATPIFSPEGQLQRFIAVENDITAIRQMQQDLSEAKDAAERASQAKTVFLAAMSHEIRTPLNGVIGMASSLTETDLDPVQRERVDIIRRSGEALVSVVNDILDYAKIEAGRFALSSEAFPLKPILEDAVNLFRGTARAKQLALIDSYVGNPQLWVQGDRRRLMQVTMNLLSNALKFTAEGEVRVEISAVPVGQEVEVNVTVTDTGIGISPTDLKRLFVHFSQLDDSVTRKAGGTGLGLAISKEVIDLMNGSISVESRLGQGSTFRVTVVLPVVTPDLPAAHLDVVLQGCEGSRILVAEDNLVNQMVLGDILETLGCQVDVADNGQIAVDRMRNGVYDMILMDIQMPVMDGLEASRQIRQSSRVPIIAVTANVLPEHMAMCQQCGMDGFVPKPVSRESIEAEMLRVLNRLN